MQNKLRRALAAAALALACSLGALAQTPPESPEILRLRSEIKRRESLERDGAEELREMNRRVLAERRTQLLGLLRAKVVKLRDSEATLGQDILPEEKAVIDEKLRVYELEIRSLNMDLEGVQVATTTPLPINTPAPSNPPAPADPAPQQAPAQPAPDEAAQAVANAELVEPVSESAEEPEDEEESPTEQRSCAEFEELKEKNPFAVSPLDNTICAVIERVRRRKDGGQPVGIDLTGEFDEMLTILIGRKDTPKFLVEVQESRVDQQVEGAPSNSGTTSLVTKGGAPAALGFAVENGALTQSVSGTTLTFRGNPLGIVRTFAGQGLITGYREDEKDAFTRFLRKVSFAFSFDTERGAEPGVFTADRQQLSSFSTRIEFINNRRPSLYAGEWEQFVAGRGRTFTSALVSSRGALLDTTGIPIEWQDPALQVWFVQTQEALRAAPSSQVEDVFRDRLSKLPLAELSPQTVATLNGFARQLGLYISGRNEIIDKIAKGTLVTFEYLNKREVNRPDTSTFTFIAEKGPGGRADLTFNGTLTLFGTRPQPLDPAAARPGRVRDFQFAGQFDYPFGDVRGPGEFVFWAAGRYERLMEDATTVVGTTIADTKGDIAVLQLGLKVPIRGLGIRLPVSVSFANRTELIKEKEVRGNFGFTFNLDQILARFMPF